MFAIDDDQAIHRVREGLRVNLATDQTPEIQCKVQKTRTFQRAPKSYAGYIFVTG
jgi:hypothetical protein